MLRRLRTVVFPAVMVAHFSSFCDFLLSLSENKIPKPKTSPISPNLLLGLKCSVNSFGDGARPTGCRDIEASLTPENFSASLRAGRSLGDSHTLINSRQSKKLYIYKQEFEQERERLH